MRTLLLFLFTVNLILLIFVSVENYVYSRLLVPNLIWSVETLKLDFNAQRKLTLECRRNFTPMSDDKIIMQQGEYKLEFLFFDKKNKLNLIPFEYYSDPQSCNAWKIVRKKLYLRPMTCSKIQEDEI